MPTASEFRSKLFDQIDSLTPAQLDELPHGAIQLTLDGTIVNYNAFESKLANVSKEKAIGKNFFTEIAPCTAVKEFYGRFRDGVAARNLHAKFRFHFSFAKNPVDVTVTLFYSSITNTIWVFVRPHE